MHGRMIRINLDIQNRMYWILYGGETMSRHDCPVLAIYGHCGKSESCKHCQENSVK